MGKYQASEMWDITLAGGSYRQGMATWNYLSLVITIRSSHRNELRMQRVVRLSGSDTCGVQLCCNTETTLSCSPCCHTYSNKWLACHSCSNETAISCSTLSREQCEQLIVDSLLQLRQQRHDLLLQIWQQCEQFIAVSLLQP